MTAENKRLNLGSDVQNVLDIHEAVRETKTRPSPAKQNSELVLGCAVRRFSESEAVRRALAVDETLRAEVMVAFRRAGGDLDRWNRNDQIRMAALLTAAEDRVEMRPPRRGPQFTEWERLRNALRDVRRLLEVA